MKMSKVGIVAVAILLAVTGVWLGVAQAGGAQSEGTVLSFEEMEALEQGSSTSSYAESRPVLSFEDQELPQMAKSPADDVQLENPIETGSLPAESNSDFDPFSRDGL